MGSKNEKKAIKSNLSHKKMKEKREGSFNRLTEGQTANLPTTTTTITLMIELKKERGKREKRKTKAETSNFVEKVHSSEH